MENIFAPSLQPLLVFLFASGVSFAGSLQVGLVNVSVIKAVLVRSRKAALWMALGGCLPELFYASLAIVAGGFVIRHPQVAELLDYALAAVFLGVGIVALLRKPHAPQNSILRAGQTRGVFWQGLALAMINPQLLPFWFGVYVYAQRTLFPLGSMALQLCFVCGTAFGAWLLLFVLVHTAKTYCFGCNATIQAAYWAGCSSCWLYGNRLHWHFRPVHCPFSLCFPNLDSNSFSPPTCMHQDIKYWHLRNHQLFSHMSSEDIQALCVITAFRKAKKNEIIDLSDAEKRVYSLKKGTIKIISLTADGIEVTKEILQQGDIFGEISLDSAQARAGCEYARAASPEVSICSFKVVDFEVVLQKNPMLAIRYTKQMGDKLKAMENRFSNLVFKDTRTRLTEFLREFALHNGKRVGNAITTQHFLTHHDIASLIGASRQTVSTLMNELTESHLLDYSRSAFTITDLPSFR